MNCCAVVAGGAGRILMVLVDQLGENVSEQMEMLPLSPPVKHSQAQEWDLTKAKKCIGMDKYCGCGQLVVQNAQTCNVMCNCLWG